MLQAKKPDGSEGTCKLEVTYRNSEGKAKIIPANGCIVKNDENLQSYIQDHINSSADKVQFKNAKYFSYTSDRELFKKLKKKCIFRAKISCYCYSKSKEKTCVIENPQFVTVDEGDEQHIFLLCDSKDFDNSTFLKDHCKRVRTHQSVDENKIFVLIEDQTRKLKFVPIHDQEIKDSAKPGDTGPILSLDDNSDKVVIGCYRIKEDGAISYSVFGKNQVQGSSSANDIHPTITSSASKTSPSCNGTSSSNDLPSRNDNPSSNDKPSFNGILSCNGIPSRNDNPSSNCDLETTDHSDGPQSRRQMADDGEPDLTHTEEEETKERFWRVIQRWRDLLKELKRQRVLRLATILHHPGVKDGLCERLDPEYRRLPNWKHLADHVKAPTSVKEEGRSYTKYSPTELLFEVPKVSSVTVNSLLMALRDIKRYDVRNKIIKVIPENERNMKVSETLLTDDHLLDEVAVMLDTPRKGFRNNWEVLGHKLGLSRDDLNQIKRGNNPANQLLQYAYRELEAKNLKAGYFYGLFLEREDIKNFLDGLGITQEDCRSINDIFISNSRDMRKLCALLNTNSGVTKNNWKYLAYKWGIEADTYNPFDKTYQEKPSPTGKLLNWLIKEHPDFTVGELCKHLIEMGRSGVADFLKEKACEYNVMMNGEY